MDSPPTLLLLTEGDGNTLRQYTYDSVSQPPVDSFQSPFLGWELEKIAEFLSENTRGTVVDQAVFLVADGQTANDGDTLLLVHNLDGSLQSVRVSAAYGNTEAISVSVATTDLDELRSLVDDDGVFRGGRRGQPPKKGGSAPKKQL